MGFGTFIHHVGTFLLLAATVLLIITDISAPVVKDISILRVELSAEHFSSTRPVVTFGTFGYCVQGTGDADFCTASHLGYDPVSVIEKHVPGADVPEAGIATARALTKVMVLHPVATILVFIAFLLALGSGLVGSLLAALAALLAFVVTVVAMACDFAAFAVVGAAVGKAAREAGGGGQVVQATATYGSAAWTILVAAVCCLVAVFLVFLSCCSARRRRRSRHRHADADTAAAAAGEKRGRRGGWFRRG